MNEENKMGECMYHEKLTDLTIMGLERWDGSCPNYLRVPQSLDMLSIGQLCERKWFGQPPIK